MKLRFSHFILILILAAVGYLLEPLVYPNAHRVVHTKPQAPEVQKPVVVVEQPQPKKEDPVAVEPEEPEEPEIVYEDNDDEPDETDLDTTDVKKLRRLSLAEDGGRGPAVEEKYVSPATTNPWRNPKAFERRLASDLRSHLKSMSNEAVKAYIQKPETRLKIAQWELLHRSDIDELAKLMRNKATADDLAKLLNDLQWVAAFVYDAEMVHPEVALAMIRQFRQVDPNMDKDALDDNSKVKPGVKRRIAAAVAVQFTRNKWYGEERELSREELKAFKDTGVLLPTMGGKSKKESKKDHFRLARERYLFFSKSWDDGLLNTYFGTMPNWLMHFACGWKGNSPFGTATTMEWLRDNTSARAINFTGMAFQVDYLPLSKYGDTIFTPQYYEPYNVLYPGNFAKETRDLGAVCGGLSHFGASSACANGVPAVTMGEPGHCAYAVYANGKWHPTNTISEKRSPHWGCWGIYNWSAFQMMTDMYEDGQRTRDAQMVSSLANLFSRSKNPTPALKLYEMAVTMQPLYTPVWTDYLETAAKYLARRPGKYLGINDFLCTSVAPKHPEMCARYLTETIYPTLLKSLRTPKQKMVAFSSYFDNLHENEKAEWDMETLLNMQYESLPKGNPAKETYFKMLSEKVSRKPEFGVALSWAVRKAYADNKILGEKVRKMVDHLLTELPKDEQNEKIRCILNAAIVRAAEEMSAHTLAGKHASVVDLSKYRQLANEYSKDYLTPGEKAKPMPKFTPPAGQLISPGGIVMLDEYAANQTSIVKHAAALTEAGGHIETEKGKHKLMTVELPKRSFVGGVVVVPTNGCSSYRDWKIEYSVDGKTWKLLANLPNSQDKPQIVVNLNHPVNAQYLRIDSGGEQNTGIDFKAFLVYDNSKKNK